MNTLYTLLHQLIFIILVNVFDYLFFVIFELGDTGEAFLEAELVHQSLYMILMLHIFNLLFTEVVAFIYNGDCFILVFFDEFVLSHSVFYHFMELNHHLLFNRKEVVLNVWNQDIIHFGK